MAKIESINSHPLKKDERLTVAIIGDSWASKRKLDTIIVNRLKEANITSRVLSSGHPGANSKRVYENLFADKIKPYSSQFILNSNPDYCVVIAGVNDSHGQYGESYYSHHVLLIVKTLQKLKIKPIVVELPEYGIEESYNDLGFLTRMRNLTLSQITNDGNIDNIQRYRATFLNKANPEKNGILLIDFDAVCKEYKQGSPLFKSDHLHLSLAGQQALGARIATSIVQDLKRA